MGWFIVSIVLPFIAPLVALAVFKTLPLPVPTSLIVPFKDGQLCWGALGCCASALYEIVTPPENQPFVIAGATGWITGALIATLAVSALIATGGAVFFTPLPRPPQVKWWRHFRCLLASVVLTLLATSFYAVVHFDLLRPSSI